MSKEGTLLTLLLVSAWGILNPRLGLAQKKAEADTLTRLLKSDVAYQADEFRDPFKSTIVSDTAAPRDSVNPLVPEVSPPELKVQGIFWGGDFPQAIVNDKVVKVGDEVNGAQIVSIEKDIITVFFVNRQFKISSPASSNPADFSRQGKKEGFNEK